MKTEARAELARGVVSLVGLLCLLVLPPVLLVVLIGWPLPTAVPSLEEIQRSLTIGFQDEVIVKAIALLGWVVWLWVAATVLVESIALHRRRAARQLPLLSGLQAGIGRLVASSAVVISSLGSGVAGASNVATVPVVSLIGPAEGTATRHERSAAISNVGRRSGLPEAVALPAIQVERHDSYWSIAERALGDGLRWRDIRDLNIGRVMADGHTITASDDLLCPGWTLAVPADAAPEVTTSVPPAAPASVPVGEVTVQPGDNMWSLAEAQLADTLGRSPENDEVTPYWLRFIDENSDRLVEPDNPDLIYPGQTFVVPSVETTEPPSTASPEPTAPPPPSAPDPSPEAQDVAPLPATENERPSASSTTPPESDDNQPSKEAPEHQDGDGTNSPTIVLLGAVSAALAVGVTEAIRRRRQRRNQLAPDTVPAPTGKPRLHRQLLEAADETSVGQVRRRLAELATAIAARRLRCRPRVVQHGNGRLDVLLDHPATPAVEGWRAEASGQIWSCDLSEPGVDEDAGAELVEATPLLVTLGRADGDDLYLDLEAAGLTVLTGNVAMTEGLLRGIITELAYSPARNDGQVLVVGDLGEACRELDRVTAVDDWDLAARDIDAWLEQSSAVLAEHAWSNPFVARGMGNDDEALTPLLVVGTGLPEDLAVLDRVMSADPPPALGVIAIGTPPPGAMVIECDTDELRLPQLGLTFGALPLAADEVAALADLVQEADAPAGEPFELFPLDVDPDWTEASPVAEDAYEDPPHEVLVRLLGDITVDGSRAAMTAKQTALVAYIALHGTVTADAVEEAVWGTGMTGSHRKRLANVLSECRRLIGASHLRFKGDGQYVAGQGLLTDVELFDRRVAAAASQDPTDAVPILRGAVDLARGRVFSYRNADRASFIWVDVENWVSDWEQKITAVAQHLAELHLDLGQPKIAVEVAEQVLRVVPVHTGVTETLMRSHAAAGDLHTVRTVYESHVRALDALGLDDPADSIVTLYDQLRRGQSD